MLSVCGHMTMALCRRSHPDAVQSNGRKDAKHAIHLITLLIDVARQHQFHADMQLGVGAVVLDVVAAMFVVDVGVRVGGDYARLSPGTEPRRHGEAATHDGEKKRVFRAARPAPTKVTRATCEPVQNISEGSRKPLKVSSTSD